MPDNEKIENQENELEQPIPGENQEIPEITEEETRNSDAGEKEAETQAAEEADAGSSTEDLTIDGLEIPIPDLKPQTKEDYIEARIRKKREREERQLEELRQEQIKKDQEEIIKLKAQQAAAQAAMHAPKREDYGTEEDFVEASIDHSMAKRQIQQHVEKEQREIFTARQKLFNDIEVTKNKGSAKYSDFDEVVAPLFESGGDIPPNIPLVDAINESKYGADILYLLGKNKKKAIEIASLHPSKALRWLWETENKFEQAQGKSRATSASAGVKVMPKVNSKLTPHKDIGAMSTKEYAEYWKKTRFSN